MHVCNIFIVVDANSSHAPSVTKLHAYRVRSNWHSVSKKDRPDPVVLRVFCNINSESYLQSLVCTLTASICASI